VTNDEPRYDGWKIDKHIPIAVLIALAANLIWGTWQAAQLSSLVENLSVRVLKLETSGENRENRLTRIETEFISQKFETNRRLDSIEGKLDRLLEGRANERGPFERP
jgi:hypothetical protein